MAVFMSLINLTEKGLKIVKHTTERAESFTLAAEQLGVRVQSIYWTMGQYDLVIIVDAPSDEVVATLLLSVGSLGNIRAHTFRAFSAEEMAGIMSRIF